MTPTDPSRSTPSRTPWLVAGLTVVVDQLTKFAVLRALLPGESTPILPPIVYLTYVQNTGAAFGLFKGLTAVLTVLSVGVAWWLIRTLRTGHTLPRIKLWGLALVLGGAVGNLIDRLRFGFVIDFLDVRLPWPVFNVADSAITIGVGLLIWHSLVMPRARSAS